MAKNRRHEGKAVAFRAPRKIGSGELVAFADNLVGISHTCAEQGELVTFYFDEWVYGVPKTDPNTALTMGDVVMVEKSSNSVKKATSPLPANHCRFGVVFADSPAGSAEVEVRQVISVS